MRDPALFVGDPALFVGDLAVFALEEEAAYSPLPGRPGAAGMMETQRRVLS